LLVIGLGSPTQSLAEGERVIQASATRPVSPEPVAEFIVTTAVHYDGNPKPASQYRILFRDGVVYEFPQGDSPIITFYDFPNSRIILFDRTHQTRCAVATESLIQFAARTDAAVTDPAQRERLGLNATVQEQPSGTRAIAFDAARYEVDAKHPELAAHASSYGQYVDWACRLNMARANGLPPFARMTLNRYLTQRGLMPVSTNLSIEHPAKGNQPAVSANIASRTSWTAGWDEQAKRQADEIAGFLVLYREVSWTEFSKQAH